jgi:hypothetical protein
MFKVIAKIQCYRIPGYTWLLGAQDKRLPMVYGMLQSFSACLASTNG